jgi:hypothetical protein
VARRGTPLCHHRVHTQQETASLHRGRSSPPHTAGCLTVTVVVCVSVLSRPGGGDLAGMSFDGLGLRRRSPILVCQACHDATPPAVQLAQQSAPSTQRRCPQPTQGHTALLPSSASRVEHVRVLRALQMKRGSWRKARTDVIPDDARGRQPPTTSVFVWRLTVVKATKIIKR